MTDAFAQLVDPVIYAVIGVLHEIQAGKDPDPARVKSELKAAFEAARIRAAGSGQLAADFELARYALVYWADEMLITSLWPHADAWRNQMLEWDEYKENLAGEKFFEKAAQAERLTCTDALETYFLCVALGFQGRLSMDHQALRGWSDRMYQRVAGSAQQGGRFLNDDEPPRDPLAPLPGTALLWRVSLLASATVLVSVIVLILSHTLG